MECDGGDGALGRLLPEPCHARACNKMCPGLWSSIQQHMRHAAEERGKQSKQRCAPGPVRSVRMVPEAKTASRSAMNSWPSLLWHAQANEHTSGESTLGERCCWGMAKPGGRLTRNQKNTLSGRQIEIDRQLAATQTHERERDRERGRKIEIDRDPGKM